MCGLILSCFTANTCWRYILGSLFLRKIAEVADLLVSLVHKPMSKNSLKWIWMKQPRSLNQIIKEKILHENNCENISKWIVFVYSVKKRSKHSSVGAALEPWKLSLHSRPSERIEVVWIQGPWKAGKPSGGEVFWNVTLWLHILATIIKLCDLGQVAEEQDN